MEIKVDAVLIGRILAGVIIFLAILSAIVGAASAREGGFEIFLIRLAAPLGIGFLIIMATEILRVLERNGHSTHSSGSGGGD